MNFPYYLVSVFIEYRNVVMLQKYLFDSLKKNAFRPSKRILVLPSL